MAVKPPSFKKKSVKQTINLEREFGVSFVDAPRLRNKIGRRIVEKQKERTLNNKKYQPGGGRPGGLEKPYSEKYVNSKAFKDAGKSANDVNMTLKGKMLKSWGIVKKTTNTITQGFSNVRKNVENKKAFNHNTGDTVPQRPFFGVTNSELKQIKKEFKPELDKLKKR